MIFSSLLPTPVATHTKAATKNTSAPIDIVNKIEYNKLHKYSKGGSIENSDNESR
jgi:hypothetical protein